MDILTPLSIAILLVILALGAFVVWSHYKTQDAITALTKLITGEPSDPVHASAAFRGAAPTPPMSSFSFGEKKASPPPEPAPPVDEIKPAPKLPPFKEACTKCTFPLSVEARYCASCNECKGVEHMHTLCSGCKYALITATRN